MALLLVRSCRPVALNQRREQSARSVRLEEGRRPRGLSLTIYRPQCFFFFFNICTRRSCSNSLDCPRRPCCSTDSLFSEPLLFMSSSTCFPLLFVCNSCLYLPALVSWRNKSCTKVPGIEALILSKLPLNYLSHRAGNARLTGGYQVLHCGTKMSVCSNLPPWINIQWGFSHFARLFVEYADAHGRAHARRFEKKKEKTRENRTRAAPL